ncbi:MAG: hypothetical protein C0602_05805 [Denitrovibrio sp.]|nr:MAG: hypothetical protein C0602_05805 [Denitrovibrio sp.]
MGLVMKLLVLLLIACSVFANQYSEYNIISKFTAICDENTPDGKTIIFFETNTNELLAIPENGSAGDSLILYKHNPNMDTSLYSYYEAGAVGIQFYRSHSMLYLMFKSGSSEQSYKCTIMPPSAHMKEKIKIVKLKDLHEYVGSYVKTCSNVASVYFSKAKGRPVFLNFGNTYPNQLFSVVIWGRDAYKFTYNLNSLTGKTVCVRGSVKSYKGKPTMYVTEEMQIEF